MSELLLCLALAVSAPPSTIVVATQSSPVLFERMALVRDWDHAVDGLVIDVVELQRRLTKLEDPARPNTSENSRRLSMASECEANFDAACADRLRRAVVRAYDNSFVPNSELRTLAAMAFHGLAAHELSESRESNARELARTAIRRFPHIAIDGREYPPQVNELMLRATADLRRVARGLVTFRTTKPGRLTIDDTQTVTIDSEVTRSLPYGDYRVWVQDDDGTSLVHRLNVTSTAMTVEIDFDLESRLSWVPVIALACDRQCDQLLGKLARVGEVEQAIGVSLDDLHAPATGRVVSHNNQPAESRPIVALADVHHVATVTPPPPQLGRSETSFSPWALVPFGVGQFAQRRYVAGGVYAAVQAGLAAWHVLATTRANAYDGPSLSTDEERRAQRNLSGALLIGAMVANIAEAVVVDAVSQ